MPDLGYRGDADLTKSVPHITERLRLQAGVKGYIVSSAASVAVPTIGTQHQSGTVNVTVTGAALGDQVLVAAPTAALPTNAQLIGAFVSAADTVTLVYQAVGGTVTGATKTHDIVVADRT